MPLSGRKVNEFLEEIPITERMSHGYPKNCSFVLFCVAATSRGCVKTLKLPASSFVSVRVDFVDRPFSFSKIRSTKSHEQKLTGNPSLDTVSTVWGLSNESSQDLRSIIPALVSSATVKVPARHPSAHDVHLISHASCLLPHRH